MLALCAKQHWAAAFLLALLCSAHAAHARKPRGVACSCLRDASACRRRPLLPRCLLCGIPPADSNEYGSQLPLPAVDVGGAIKGFLKGKVKDLAAEVATAGAGAVSNAIATGLEAAGEAEAAEAVRQSGDVVEQGIPTAMDAVGCYGSVAKGAGMGSRLGPYAAVGGALVAGFFNSACHDAVKGLFAVGDEADEAVKAAQAAYVAAQPQCTGGQVQMADRLDCIEYCDSQASGW